MASAVNSDSDDLSPRSGSADAAAVTSDSEACADDSAAADSEPEQEAADQSPTRKRSRTGTFTAADGNQNSTFVDILLVFAQEMNNIKIQC